LQDTREATATGDAFYCHILWSVASEDSGWQDKQDKSCSCPCDSPFSPICQLGRHIRAGKEKTHFRFHTQIGCL